MGLEPMTPAVTGRYSIQLSYATVLSAYIRMSLTAQRSRTYIAGVTPLLFDTAKITKVRHMLQIYFCVLTFINHNLFCGPIF